MKTCKTCGGKMNRWAKIYCSKVCQGASQRGENSPNWVGDKVKYWGIHDWLYSKYGNADKCENPKCLGKSNNYQWAKIKHKKYERKRENFWKLCVSCHSAYDITRETILKKQARPVPAETRLKISRGLKKYFANI